jgi:hypothetical protein
MGGPPVCRLGAELITSLHQEVACYETSEVFDFDRSKQQNIDSRFDLSEVPGREMDSPVVVVVVVRRRYVWAE